MHFHTPDWDLTLFAWINQDIHNRLFDVVMPLLSSDVFLWAISFGLLAAGMKFRRVTATMILGVALCIAVSDQVCYHIKEYVGRVRPYQSLAGTRYQDSGAWMVRPTDFTPQKRSGSSFPSSHASNAAAAVTFLYVSMRRKALWAIPLAVGFSRIYLGKHFPTDVLAGWAVGLAVGSALAVLYPALCSRIRSRWMRYRLRT